VQDRAECTVQRQGIGRSNFRTARFGTVLNSLFCSAVSLLFLGFSLLRNRENILKFVALSAPYRGALRFCGPNLPKFPVFSLLNREFGGDGFARDCQHHHSLSHFQPSRFHVCGNRPFPAISRRLRSVGDGDRETTGPNCGWRLCRPFPATRLCGVDDVARSDYWLVKPSRRRWALQSAGSCGRRRSLSAVRSTGRQPSVIASTMSGARKASRRLRLTSHS